MASLHCGVEHF